MLGAVIEKMPTILTVDYTCRCGQPIRIPIRPEWDNPAYVMGVIHEHDQLKLELGQIKSDLLVLARECLNAGLKPEILRRADELRKRLDAWSKRLK